MLQSSLVNKREGEGTYKKGRLYFYLPPEVGGSLEKESVFEGGLINGAFSVISK